MKYIRTKDGIYDSKDVMVVNENGTLIILRDIDEDFVERTRGKSWNYGTNVIIKQSDTIEELCDEFISVSIIIKVINNRLEIIKTLANKSDVIYGAIWTNKGLIYVAKLNDKGELELL